MNYYSRFHQDRNELFFNQEDASLITSNSYQSHDPLKSANNVSGPIQSSNLSDLDFSPILKTKDENRIQQPAGDLDRDFEFIQMEDVYAPFVPLNNLPRKALFLKDAFIFKENRVLPKRTEWNCRIKNNLLKESLVIVIYADRIL